MAMQQLLRRHAAIALSRCSNEPYLYNRIEYAVACRDAAAGWRAMSRLMGACQKSRRDDRPQTGVLTPGNNATTEKALKGRQSHKQVVIKQVIYSVAPLGLIIVRLTCSGGYTPVCVLLHLWCFSPDSSKKQILLMGISGPSAVRSNQPTRRGATMLLVISCKTLASGRCCA